jgi:hypothetical protein
MQAKGTFDVEMQPEPPYHQAEGVTLSRMAIDKKFEGALTGTSQVQMLAARTAIEGSAAYVALERVDGVLDEKRGSFVVTHVGHMRADHRSLRVEIVADSGTGELEGITGSMDIDIQGGQHFYTLDYTL